MLNNQKGMTLVSTMVAVGLLGIVSLASMQLFKNLGQNQVNMLSVADEVALREGVRQILLNENFCRISIAGRDKSGVVAKEIDGSNITLSTFRKFQHDDETSLSEGIDIGLYFSNSDSDQRSQEKFLPGTKLGRIEVDSIKLYLNNGPANCYSGTRYCESTKHYDIGEVIVRYQKKISKTVAHDKELSFTVPLTMSTDAGGNTSILSCEKEKDEYIPDLSSCQITRSGTTIHSNYQDHTAGCAGIRAITGFEIYASDRLDGELAVSCCQVRDAQSHLGFSTQYLSTTSSGNTTVNCPAGMFATAMAVFAANKYTGPAKLWCVNFNGASVDSTKCYDLPGTPYQKDDTWHQMKCLPNSVLTGVQFRGSGELDHVNKITCCSIAD